MKKRATLEEYLMIQNKLKEFKKKALRDESRLIDEMLYPLKMIIKLKKRKPIKKERCLVCRYLEYPWYVLYSVCTSCHESNERYLPEHESDDEKKDKDFDETGYVTDEEQPVEEPVEEPEEEIVVIPIEIPVEVPVDEVNPKQKEEDKQNKNKD